MKKIILYGVGGVVALTICGTAGVLVYMDGIARSAIEQGGTYALGVDVSLDSADVQPLAGRFDMHNLTVDNPEGFPGDHFMDLNGGGVAVTLSSLRNDVVEMGELKLTGMDVRLEGDLTKSNYGVILDNLKRFESGESKPAEGPSGSGKKFVIREVNLENITVNVGLKQLPAAVPIKVPLIKLTNVGTAGDPVDMGELVSILLKAILRTAVDVGGDLLPADMIGDLSGALAQLKTEDVQRVVEGAKKQMEDAAAKIKADVEDAAKGLGAELKGLLPPKKEGDDGN